MSEHRLPERDRPWVMRTYAGHSDARRSNELYRGNLAKGQTGLSVAFDLPTQTGYDPDHVLARGEVGKVGVSIAHKGDMHQLLRRDPARRDEHLDDDQRDRRLAARPLRHGRRGERRRPRRSSTGHDPERHHQGVPLARHLRLPAGALDAADRRHGRLHRQRGAELEPDQHLQLPPAGGRGDAGAGDRLRALDRDRRARRGQGARPGRRGRLPQGLRPHLLLRQRRHPPDRGDRQAARDGPALERDRPRALRGHRREDAALPLRRPGQLARPDRGPAGEQHPAHRARGAGGDAEPRRPRPRDPAARLERGDGPAPPLGPAVEPAHPAGAGQRDRPARVPRHLRGLER